MSPPPSQATGRGPLVYKFGGSSVGDADRIRHVATLVHEAPSRPVVVVSAVAGTTNLLVELIACRAAGLDSTEVVAALVQRHRPIIDALTTGDPEGRISLHAHLDDTLGALVEGDANSPSAAAGEDDIRALGEDLSSALLAYAITRRGTPAQVVDARHVVRTDARAGAAVLDETAIREAACDRLLPLLERGIVPVIQGFVGSDPQGRTTTLGRGGSDFTATLLGAALDAREVHIWTDVDGILSGDPKAVTAPRNLERIGFEEAVELAHFGARVLHPGAAKHAVSRGLAVRIRSTFAPERAGTLILRERWGAAEIAAVAFKPGGALIQVRSHPSAMPYGFLARVFEVLTRHRLPVDLVATSHTSTAFTLDVAAEISAAADELEAFADVRVRTQLTTVTVVGHGLLEESGLTARVFAVVDQTPVHLISQASDVSLSLVVDDADAPGLVRRLHHALIESRTPASTAEEVAP